MTKNNFNSETIETIKLTSPLIMSHGKDILRTMFESLFLENPEFKEVFGVSGLQTPAVEMVAGLETSVLMNAVYLFAINVYEPSVKNHLVKLIVNKQAYKNIQVKHYPIIGTVLFKSVGVVLGDSVDTKVVDAWREVYWHVVNILIDLSRKTEALNLDHEISLKSIMS